MKHIIFVPCSGSEYNGELARHIAIKLSEKSPIADMSSMLCFTILLRTNLLEEPSFEIMKNDLTSNYIVVIDGCSGACAFKILKHLKITPDLVINLNKLVPKSKINLNDPQAFINRPRMSNLRQEDIDKVTHYILNQLQANKIIDLSNKILNSKIKISTNTS
ncbi:MAG: putative zinc-binding protein [Candidatus Helarchaeota archaeon]